MVNVHGSVYQATYSQDAYANAEENSKTNINTEFERLQISIDKVLKVKDGRYIYNTEEVKRVIKNKNFDFDEFNKVNKTNYTLQSFTEQTLKNLNDVNFDYKYSYPVNSSSGLNITIEVWNYFRYFRDYNLTQKAISILKQSVIDKGLLTIIIGVFGDKFSVILPAFSTWYSASLLNALEYNNSLNYDGTVTDINKFTKQFSVYNQRYFNG